MMECSKLSLWMECFDEVVLVGEPVLILLGPEEMKDAVLDAASKDWVWLVFVVLWLNVLQSLL